LAAELTFWPGSTDFLYFFFLWKRVYTEQNHFRILA